MKPIQSDNTMRYLILFIILVFITTTLQAQQLTNVNIVRSGYWVVSSPDTSTNHTTDIQAVERLLNLMLAGYEADSLGISPPTYEIRIDLDPYMKFESLILEDFHWTHVVDSVRQLVIVRGVSITDSISLEYQSPDSLLANHFVAVNDSFLTDTLFLPQAYADTVFIRGQGTYKHSAHVWRDTVAIGTILEANN